MRTTIATLVLLLLAPMPAGAAPATERRAPDGTAVTGYALPSTRPAIVRRDADLLTTLTVAAVSLKPSGRWTTDPDPRTLRLVEVAHEEGLRAELLVGNYSDRLGGFDPDALSALLSSRANIDGVADRLATLVVAGGWDGVNVDLELVRRRDSRGLVTFVKTLRERLPATSSITIDVSASSTPSAYLDRGYRMAELAEVVDAIQLMAYDQHGPGWSGPGPIGGLRWVRWCLEAALELVPADKLDLGVAGYGYVWRPDGSGRTLTVKAADNLVARAGGTKLWSMQAAEWKAMLPGGREVWWSDMTAYGNRVSMAQSYGLRGTAIWRLGSMGPLDVYEE
ncbi:glycosyl hydrolase family 18 protein [Nocardioides hwasunensis]|uniref:Hydrolase n=1 Tax=Nocardioides hwasunensis TaxID=397258 RepID=A0ABR8MLF3_9ACTN|nr:glycosyl hydrolase family 18 protein [Nocardioides hwasunensis]MBD3916854.1 hydrolase [Nocardioides hwasunensis]